MKSCSLAFLCWILIWFDAHAKEEPSVDSLGSVPPAVQPSLNPEIQQQPEWYVVHTNPDLGNLSKIWGTDENNVWACGDGAILHFDGKKWYTRTIPNFPKLRIRELELADIYLQRFREIGHRSFQARTALNFPNGEIWFGGSDEFLMRTHPTEPPELHIIPFHDSDLGFFRTMVAGFIGSPDTGLTVVLFGGAIYHRNNHGLWTRRRGLIRANSFYLTSLGGSQNDIWAVGSGVYRLQGSNWKSVMDYHPLPMERGLHEIWWGSSNDVWVAGVHRKRANLKHWDGKHWSANMLDRPEGITTIAGTSSNDLWIAGYSFVMSGGGAIQVKSAIFAHYDGSTWTVSENPLAAKVSSMWGSAPNNYWAVGMNGTILRYGIKPTKAQ